MISLSDRLLDRAVDRRALLITGGASPSRALIAQGQAAAAFTMCADSGAASLVRLGLWPDMIVGDMDSLAPEVLAQLKDRDCESIILPVEKDFTDTQAALEWLFQHDYQEVLVLGGTGSRWDHSTANYFLVTGYGRQGQSVVMWDEKNAMRYIAGHSYQVPASNHQLSLVPTSDEGVELSLTGLYYGLDSAQVPCGQSLLISNEFVGPEATVTISRGDAWLFVSCD
ncbi:thiamine diphosphokinase [Peptococcus simiae]|uniref:Thiamine diphosphokinase n=1 Tax=Peptococcus simiae TaxID=1643805 RepID=A0ABW9GZR6_9FIRM